MSRIFDALKRAERDHRPATPPQPPAASSTDPTDRRRSRRRHLDVPVYVYVHEVDTPPFHEETRTLNVNAQGALLLLSVPVCKGQKLILTNALTEKDQDCQVVFLGTRRSRTVEAGVAFPYPNPEFWPVPREHRNGAAD